MGRRATKRFGGRRAVRPAPGAAALGLALDELVGDPADRWHPVAWFGRAASALEARLWQDGRGAGIVFTGTGVAAGAAAGRAVRSATVATAVAAGGKSLAAVARQVAVALDRGDLEGARALLPSLVGRDPTGLDEQEISRAVVESVAENTVDAVVAPAFWAAVGGAEAVLAHRAANTLDAMVGHRSPRYERFGWASARLDDAANWVPARLTAALVAGVRPHHAARVVEAVRREAPPHPSPNAGVAEAAFATALGVSLGGVNRYGDRREERPTVGAGPPPRPADIERAVALARDVRLLLVLVLGAIGLSRTSGPRRRSRRSPSRP